MLSPLISHPAATAETRLSRWIHRLIDESAVELKLVLIWIWQHLPVFMTESLLFMFSHGMTDPTILRRDLGKTIPDENLSAVEILPGKMTHRAALEYPGLSQAKIDVTQLVLSLSPAPLRKLNHHASPWLYSRLKAPAISETYSLNISPHHQCHHSVEPSPYPHPGE